MSRYDDKGRGHGLGRWEDDDLVRALRAPGRPSELAGEEQYVAAFRAAHGHTGTVVALRRGIRRLGAGGTAVVIAVGLSSGVAAAAYTRNLPDPVQRVVHDVLGAPAPESDASPSAAKDRQQRTPSTTATSSPDPSSSGTPDAAPTTPAGEPSSVPTRTSTAGPTGKPAPGPTHGPTPSAAPPPTPTPTDPTPAPAPAAMTVAGTAHRTAPGASVTVSGIVTAADGTPIAGQPVRLQVRGPEQWRTVADATSDDTGTVAFTTPPAVATARYRLVGAPRVHSETWRVVLVPTISATATHAGEAVEIAVAVVGARAGDRAILLRQGPERLLVVARGQLDTSGRVVFRVPARDRRTAYVVRLPATRDHGPGATQLVVVPLRPASLGITASSHEVGPGGSLLIGGVVRSADGTATPGRDVVLQVRGPHRWRPVGSATSDASGAVSLPTPVLDRTSVYRLVTGHVHSPRWRVVLMPTLQATVTAGDPAVITVNSRGGRPGDTVALLRRVDGRLVLVMRTGLAADGTAQFNVTHGKRVTRYVARLPATDAHGPARVALAVPPA